MTKEETVKKAIILAHKNGWREFDLEGKRKILNVEVEFDALYWTKWGMAIRITVNGTVITYQCSYNDLFLSTYFAKCLIGEEKVSYKLAGSYVYEWETYLEDMVKTDPEDRIDTLRAWLGES